MSGILLFQRKNSFFRFYDFKKNSYYISFYSDTFERSKKHLAKSKKKSLWNILKWEKVVHLKVYIFLHHHFPLFFICLNLLPQYTFLCLKLIFFTIFYSFYFLFFYILYAILQQSKEIMKWHLVKNNEKIPYL